MQLWCTNVSKGLWPSSLSDKCSTSATIHERQTRYRDSVNILSMPVRTLISPISHPTLFAKMAIPEICCTPLISQLNFNSVFGGGSEKVGFFWFLKHNFAHHYDVVGSRQCGACDRCVQARSNQLAVQRPRPEINIASGCPLFCPLSELNNQAYVRDDTMFLKIIVDTLDL